MWHNDFEMVLEIDEVKKIAKQITSANDKRHYNSIIKLINGLTVEDTSILKEDSVERNIRFLTVAVHQIFKKLFDRGDLTLDSATRRNRELLQFTQWLRKAYESFKRKILLLIAETPFETSLALDCQDVYIQLLESESIHFASNEDTPFFPNKSLKNLIVALWQSDLAETEQDTRTGQSENTILKEFLEKYYSSYVDIQYYFQTEFKQLLEDEREKYTSNKSIAKWLTLVNNHCHCSESNNELEVFIPNPPTAINSVSKYKSNIEKNWLVLLGGELSLQQYKTILLVLHKRIIPHFHEPTKLMDFLTDSYDLQATANSGDVVPILALNGLFALILRYNLEYPNFYAKLYQLLTPNLFHVKYRARFFRLMDTFLASTHLSAHLVASFIKRLARLTLSAPPGAIVSVIPFVYNLLRKHPSCMIMLHNPAFISSPFMSTDDVQKLKNLKADYRDPFDASEPNPENTKALDSSLWELATLMDHYHPNVATLAKMFGQPFRKLNYNMEDFLDWSYDSLLAAETSRKLKVLPTLEYEAFDRLFEDDDIEEKKSFLAGVTW